MNARPVNESAAQRAAAVRAPMGELDCVIAERGSARTWFVVRPHDEVEPRLVQLGLTLEPGCRVVVESPSLLPVGVRAPDEPAPSATGFNPYFDLPPA